MAEYIRMSLKRYISHKYTRGNSTLIVYLLDPAIEDMVRDRDLLSADEMTKILDAVFKEVRGMPPSAQQPVILTTAHIRHGIRKLLRTEFPQLHVLSYQELSPEMNIQPIARISLQ
jgi:type III secretion protein V